MLAAILLTGAFTSVDLRTHDLLDRLREQRATDHRVILIAIDTESLGALGPMPWEWADIDALFAPVFEAHPPAVGLLVGHDQLFPLGEYPPGLLGEQLAAGKVVLPSRLMDPAGPSLPSVGHGAYGTRRDDPLGESSFGLLLIEPDDDGVVRHQPLQVDTGSGRMRTIENVLLGERPELDQEGATAISYVGPAGSVAHVSAVKVVRGEIESRVFDNRIVLLGVTDPSVARTFNTPMSPGAELMPAAEIHANALATVLDGHHIRTPVLLPLLLLLPFLLVLDALYRRGEMLATVVLGVIVMAGAAGVTTLAWYVGQIRLPVTVLALAIIGPLTLESVARVVRSRRRMQALLTELGQAVSFRPMDDGQANADRFWNHTAGFLTQFTGSMDCIVGERIGSRQRFHWVGTTSTPLDEVRIDETILRKPQLLRAIRSGRPSVLPGAEWSDYEDVVVVPLSASGEVVGLALLVVGDGPAALRSDGTRFVAAGVVGGRMIEQQMSSQDARQDSGGLLRALTRMSLDHQIDMAGALSRMMVEEHAQWQGIYQGLPLGVLFADMMGELQLANDASRLLLQRAGYRWAPGSSLAEMLASLTGRDIEDVSSALFMAHRAEEPMNFRWEVSGAARRTFRATLTPVVEPDREEQPRPNTESSDANRGTPMGYLCTIEDITVAEEIMRARSAIVDALGTRARTHLMILQGVTEMLMTRADLPDQANPDLARILAQGNALTQLLDDFAASTAISEEEGSGVVPVDLSVLTHEIVEHVSEAFSAAERLSIRTPVICTPILADRNHLAQALYRVISDSLVNSPAGNVTRVVVVEGDDSVVVEVRDQGYGIPKAVLGQMRTQPEDGSSIPEVLFRARQAIQANGGSLEIDSKVGRGTTYRIQFRKSGGQEQSTAVTAPGGRMGS